MKSLLTYCLLAALFISGSVQAQRFSPYKTSSKLDTKLITSDCKEVLSIPLKNGRVHTSAHKPTSKVRTWTQGGKFYIKATATIKESDFTWAKFVMKPGFPGADITGLKTTYQVKSSPNNNAKLCYISQSRIYQGPSTYAGTVRLDDPTNLYGSGQHFSTPLVGNFACGSDYKTISYKLVMQAGDLIVFDAIQVMFDCPKDLVSVLCPPNLPNPFIQLAGTQNGNGFTRYLIPVINHNAYPNFLFSAAPSLPACGLNTSASRTWVDIYNEKNQRIYGFCALSQSSQLQNIWFAVQKGQAPPQRVRVVMRDRMCNQSYASNWISITNS